ncbi:MAG: hypothetical protein OEY30_02985, partial [Candidatus Bathyarchaeota archaeon]|nr:hypothetical protein [Candidatus Bathyarchaeota archaeon]
RTIPSIMSVNRGKMSMDEVAEKALERDADRVVIIDRWHGGPGSIKFFRVSQSGLDLISPVIHIAGLRLQREFGVTKIKPARSMVILESNTKGEVLRVAEAFSKFFNAPILLLDEAFQVGPTQMRVSLGKGHTIVMTFMVEPNRVEVGPQIVVSSAEW